MTEDSIWRTVIAGRRATALERRWQNLCALYLPHAPRGSLWRYHRVSSRGTPACGWKLHVSASILNAATTLMRIGPVLAERGVQFKAPRSLIDVMHLNSGLHHRYSQIGKIVTVYPRSATEAVELAQILNRLTRCLAAPSVPFDQRFSRHGNVYYRFGAFRQLEMILTSGERVAAVRGPGGTLEPDIRERTRPDWAQDPFAGKARSQTCRTADPVPFRALRAVVQRGKGGVYQAIDFRDKSPRLCLLKEGRLSGETSWDGRDGAWRVRHEERVLLHLAAAGVSVPKVYSAFELQGNYYLAMEFIAGETLLHALQKLQRRIPISRVLHFGVQLANLFAQIHRAGWAWRDCKPKNIMVTPEGRLVPIDFEGAAPLNKPDHLLWGTEGFTPPEYFDILDGAAADRYALGAMLYLLLTGRIYDHSQPVSVSKLRKNVPLAVRDLVEVLLDVSPAKRPSARASAARMTSILLQSSLRPSLKAVKAA